MSEEQEKADREASIGTVIVLIVCIIITILAIAAAVYSWCCYNCEYKRFNTPDPAILNFLTETKNVLDSSNIKATTVKIVRMLPFERVGDLANAHDQKAIEEFLAAISRPQWEEEKKAQGKFETITGARDEGALPIYKDTRVAAPPTLHVNYFTDLYHNHLFLSAAPLKNQFADHLELICKYRIGVVVWVGRLTIHGAAEPRMDAYIDFRKGKSMTHGLFQLTTITVVERHLRYSIYDVEIIYKGQTRPLVIIHAYEWLQDSVTWALRRDVEVIVEIKNAHIKQILIGFPTMLFQCKWGTAGSAAMCVVYIGFQTWMAQNKVNLNAIIRYVRYCRYKAFELTGDPNHTFIIQIKVIYTVMYALTKFIETKKLEIFDEVLKATLTAERSTVMPPTDV